MGFLDNFLDDIASGKLEEHLTKVADAIESGSQKLGEHLDKVADKPAEVLKMAEDKASDIQSKAQLITNEASRNIDVIRKKD